MQPRMQAAYHNHQGKAEDALVVREVLWPESGPGGIGVRIHVSTINLTDIKARIGFSGPISLPQIVPHQNGAGVIDAVGEGVWIYLALQGRAVSTAGACTVVPAEQAVPFTDRCVL